MLNKPSLRELMNNIDSKYALVIIAAKRARALVKDDPEKMAVSTVNPVSISLKEIAEGKLKWTAESDKAGKSDAAEQSAR